MSIETKTVDVVVIGGGLAGLASATYLGRAGKSVILLEKASAEGGRARTETKSGFHLNYGAHALFVAGEGRKILKELGIEFHGAKPAIAGGYMIDRGVKHTLPVGFLSLLTSGLFGIQAKLEVARFLSGVDSFDTAPWQGVTIREWLDRGVAAAAPSPVLAHRMVSAALSPRAIPCWNSSSVGPSSIARRAETKSVYSPSRKLASDG